MNPRQAVLLAALAGSAALVYFDGGASAGDAVVEPAVRRAPPAQAPLAAAASQPSGDARLLAQTPRAHLFGAADDDPLFGSRDFTPPPPPVLAAASVTPAGPPPLPFSYIGKMVGDGQWQVFLGRGAQALVVREGMVIDDRYRIERIAPPVLTLTYLPLNQQQQLDIGSD